MVATVACSKTYCCNMKSSADDKLKVGSVILIAHMDVF